MDIRTRCSERDWRLNKYLKVIKIDRRELQIFRELFHLDRSTLIHMRDVYIVFMKNCEEYFAENYFNRRRVTGKFFGSLISSFYSPKFHRIDPFPESRNLTLAALKSNLISFNWKQ